MILKTRKSNISILKVRMKSVFDNAKLVQEELQNERVVDRKIGKLIDSITALNLNISSLEEEKEE